MILWAAKNINGTYSIQGYRRGEGKTTKRVHKKTKLYNEGKHNIHSIENIYAVILGNNHSIAHKQDNK